MTDARDRIAIRIEEARAILPLVPPESWCMDAINARIGAYETALADIDAWMTDGEEPEEPEEPEEAEPEPAQPVEAPAPPSPVHGGGVGWGEPPAQLTAEPKPEAAEPAPEAAAPVPDDARAYGAVWTDERLELAARRWNEGALTETILAEVNALPGVPCSGVVALRKQLDKLRKAGVDIAARTPGRRPAPPPGLPDGIPLDEIEEARARMLEDDRRGALDLADYFGWPLPQAQQVAEAIRAELKAAA
jgi:hypothetical protein